MKRVLVTGGAGFIGSHLGAALLLRGDAVTILDSFDDFYPVRLKRRAIAPLLAAGATLHEVDVRNEEGVARVVAQASPEVVVHLAALGGVRPSLAHPCTYIDVNVRGTASVLEAARAARVPRFIFGSSSSVYGQRTEAPFRETDAVTSPLSPYAASKAAGELLARTWHNLYGLEAIVLRLFTVYGPRQRPDLAIHKFARRMIAGEALPFYGDGEARRDYTHVDDIVAGMLAAIDTPGLADETLNLGGAHPVRLRELVTLLEQVLGVKAILAPNPAQPGDVALTCADLSRAQALLGYQPRVLLAEGLRNFAAWLRGEGRDWA